MRFILLVIIIASFVLSGCVEETVDEPFPHPLTLGGDITDKALKSENEYRGSIIKGGTTRSVSAGDIISIPSNTAHQMNPGTGHVLYIVVKITGAQ